MMTSNEFFSTTLSPLPNISNLLGVPDYDLPFQIFNNATAPPHRYSREPFLLLASYLPPNISRMPNPPHSGMGKTIGIIYSIFGLIGLIGNLIVIFMVITVLNSPSNKKSLYRPGFLLILSLSVIDLVFISFMPYLLYDTFQSEWIFGPHLCPLLWAGETLTKTVTAWLQLGLCIFCYLSIARPMQLARICQYRLAEIYIGICSSAFFLIMIPFFLYSRLYAIVYPTGDLTHPIFQLASIRCLFHPPETILHIFMAVVFLMGYVFPTILQMCFYSLIVGIVHRQKRRMRNQQMTTEFWRVAKRSMLLLAAFLTCWTPYWFIAIHNFVAPAAIVGDDTLVLILSYCIHALPYLHIALNPILYVLLNRSVREAYTLAALKRPSMFANGAGQLRHVTNRIGRSLGGNGDIPLRPRSLRTKETSKQRRRRSDGTALLSMNKVAESTTAAAGLGLGRDRIFSDASTLRRPLINRGLSPSP